MSKRRNPTLEGMSGKAFIANIAQMGGGPSGVPPAATRPTGTGWTWFETQYGSETIFVSDTDGTDAAGYGYTTGTPVKTIAYGYAMLRDGWGDRLLLKRGDTFADQAIDWQKSGAGPEYQMRLGCYGLSSDAMPIITTDTDHGITLSSGSQYLAFSDINLQCPTHLATIPAYPFYITSGTGILIEGCRCEGYDGGPYLDGCSRIKIRRNTFLDTLGGGGIYTTDVDLVLIEENLIDSGHSLYTGWPADPAAGIEIDSTTSSGVTINGNLISRQTGPGIVCGAGGDIDDNLVVNCSEGIRFGNADVSGAEIAGTVTRNVILHGTDIPAAEPRGWGLYLERISQAEISDNIVAHNLVATGPRPIQIEATTYRVNNVTFDRNIVYEWGCEAGYSTMTVLGESGVAGSDPGLANFAMRGCEFQPNADVSLVSISTPAGSTFTMSSGNNFYSEDVGTDWAKIDGIAGTLAEYLALVHDNTSTGVEIAYADADNATIAAYDTSLGGAGTISNFLTEARLQERANWRDAYTPYYANDWMRAKFGMAAKTGFPLPQAGPVSLVDDGWTRFTPSLDTRITYVSAAGDDDYCGYNPEYTTGTCKGYSGHAAGASGHGPFLTIGAGVAQLAARSGYPDWLLLRRGDTWSESLGNWTSSGRGVSEPMVVQAYGSGARPKLNVGWNNMVGLYGTAHYVAFVDLHAACAAHLVTQYARPADCTGGGNILLEGCLGEGFDNAPVFQYCHDISLRRNVFMDSEFGGGTYTYKVVNFLAEENYIDNGHLQFTGTGLPDHGMYCDSEESSGFAITGNIVSRQASHGIQCRPGGSVEGNLVLEVGIGILLGNSDGLNTPNGVTGNVSNNVVLHGRDIPAGYGPRGWGYVFENILSATAYKNVVAQGLSANGQRPVILDAVGYKLHSLTFDNNVIYKAGVENTYASIWVNGSAGATGLQDIVLRNNSIHDDVSGMPLVWFDSATGQSAASSGGNKFYSTLGAGSWFLVDGVSKTLAAYKAGFTPPDTTSTAPGSSWMPSPDDATIVGYMTSIGHGTPTLAQFYTEMRQQAKGYWRSAYTAQAVNAYIRSCFGL